MMAEKNYKKDDKKKSYGSVPQKGDSKKVYKKKDAGNAFGSKDERVLKEDLKKKGKKEYSKNPEKSTDKKKYIKKTDSDSKLSSKDSYKENIKRDSKKTTEGNYKKKDFTKKTFIKSKDSSSEGIKKKSDRKYPRRSDKDLKTKDIETDNDKSIRLNKFIANGGVSSRREADKLISEGHVKVNNKVVTEMGFKVSKKDSVKVKGKLIQSEKPVYVIINKPKGFLTTVSDDRGRKTVLDVFKGKIEERIYPVGRLDKESTGVLLLTNDGDLTKKLTHPKYNKKKIYHVFLNKDLIKDDAEKLVSGIELDDGFMKFDILAYPDPESKNDVGVEIHSGRNRIIRRMFEALGYNVEKLDRVYFAGLTKKDLKRGRWRYLTDREISNLKRGTYE